MIEIKFDNIIYIQNHHRPKNKEKNKIKLGKANLFINRLLTFHLDVIFSKQNNNNNSYRDKGPFLKLQIENNKYNNKD